MSETNWCKKQFYASIQAGKMALDMQKDIINIGKDIT